MLAVDSTTGQFLAIQEKTAELIREMGFEPVCTHKGGVWADLGGEGDPLVITPHYGTDGDDSVQVGYDIRHAAIGPGTSNSHGYERTHIDGIRNTYDLTLAYIL